MLKSYQRARNRVTVSVGAILSLSSVSEVVTALSVCPICLPVHPPACSSACLSRPGQPNQQGRTTNQAETWQGSCLLFSSLSSHLSPRRCCFTPFSWSLEEEAYNCQTQSGAIGPTVCLAMSHL